MSHVLLRRLGVAAVAGAVWAALAILLRLAGVTVVPTWLAQPVAVVLTAPAVIIGLGALVTERAPWRDRSQPLPTSPLSRLPRWAQALAAVSFVLFWLTAAVYLFGGGSPEIRNGQYVLVMRHDRVTPVDQATYERQLRFQPLSPV